MIEPVSVAAGERDVHPQRIAFRVARDVKVQHVTPRGLMAFEQWQSVWPLHGSILVQDGEAWLVAGRSVFLDGGMRLWRCRSPYALL